MLIQNAHSVVEHILDNDAPVLVITVLLLGLVVFLTYREATISEIGDQAASHRCGDAPSQNLKARRRSAHSSVNLSPSAKPKSSEPLAEIRKCRTPQ